jgi:hypothetical protein
MGEQIETLEDHPDLAANGVNVFDRACQLTTGNNNFTAIVLLKPVDTADHGRFAGPGWPANHNPFALVHLKINVAQGLEVTKRFADILQYDFWFLVAIIHVKPLVHIF